MTYSQSFKGWLLFANAHCLEAGLDALVGYHDSREENALRIDDLIFDGLEVCLDYDNMLPASMSFGTCSALRLLAAHAKSGTIRATYEGESSDTIRAPGRRDDRGLPPRHRRWDLCVAAIGGSTKALREALAAGADVNARIDDRLPIEIACRHARTNVARALLDAGAKLPAKKDALVLMLRYVAGSGNIALLELLARDARARAALRDPAVITSAILARKKSVERWLLDNGAKRPPPEEPDEPEEEWVSIKTASIAWNEGKYEHCLELLRKVDRETAYEEDIHGLTGVALQYLARYPKAIEALRKAVKVNPKDASWRNCLADALASSGHAREAATQFRKALAQVESELAKDDAKDASLWSRKAYSQNGLGRWNDALESANEALALDADHTLALVNAGRALLATNRPKEARERLERAVKSDADLPEPKLFLAIARARCGDKKGARRVLAKATAVSPHLAALAKKEPSLRAL